MSFSDHIVWFTIHYATRLEYRSQCCLCLWSVLKLNKTLTHTPSPNEGNSTLSINIISVFIYTISSSAIPFVILIISCRCTTGGLSRWSSSQSSILLYNWMAFVVLNCHTSVLTGVRFTIYQQIFIVYKHNLDKTSKDSQFQD